MRLIGPDAVGGAEVVDGSLDGGDINESSLGQVPSATSALSATTAQQLEHGRSRECGRRSRSARLRAGQCRRNAVGDGIKGRDGHQVRQRVAIDGVYCITTPYTQSQVDAVSVTLRQGNIFTLDDHIAQAVVSIAAPPACPSGQDVTVTTWDISANARVDHGFHIAIHGTPP
jgi:hypothetical protein